MGAPLALFDIPLELRIAFLGRGFRWPLRDEDVVEVWQAARYCGAVSGGLLRAVLVHQLATARLAGELLAARLEPTDRVPPSPFDVRKPPAVAAGREPAARRRARALPGR
jgi:hypothetical protein